QRRLKALLAPASARAGVRAFFKAVLDELDDPKTPSVCLLAGSLSVDVLRERELARMVLSDMKDFGAAFQHRLESAIATGELPKSFNATVSAHVLVTYLQGLFRVIRTLQDRSEV